MKRFVLIAALALVALPAKGDETFRIISSAQMPFDATGRAVSDTAGYHAHYNVGAFTQVLRLVCSSACFVAMSATGVTPTISATSATAMFLPANVPQYIPAKGREKIAVIRATADGTLYITEMSK